MTHDGQLPILPGSLCSDHCIPGSAELQKGSDCAPRCTVSSLSQFSASWPWGHRHTRTAVSTLPAPCAHPLCWRTHTSLSKSWSGSDMLLRGTLTPGSEPPVDKDTRDLRERPRERRRVEFPPQQLPAPRYLMRAMRCRACSWPGDAEGGLEGQGPASPPGQWVQHSGEEQHRRVVCEHGPGAQWGCHNEG